MAESASTPTTAQSDSAPAFTWKHFGRFVELHPVQRGWLVLWGRHDDAGRRRVLLGNRTYPDLAGARRRLADAVVALTRSRALAAEALLLLDRTSLPPHRPKDLPDSL